MARSRLQSKPSLDLYPVQGINKLPIFKIWESIPMHWRGALLKVFSCACFAAVNAMVKYVTGGVKGASLPPLNYNVVVFIENVLGALLLLPFLLKDGLQSFKTSMPGLHAFRVVTSVIGLLLWYAALSVMPIALAMALAFTGPIFSILGARVFLGEELSSYRLYAVGLSIVGAFLITRPDLAIFNHSGLTAELGWSILLPLLSAIAWVGPKLGARKLASQGEPAKRMTLYLLLFMAPVSLIPALMNWQTPTIDHMGWLFLICVASTLAYIAFDRSFAYADVIFLMPFGFPRLVFSALVAYCAFGELPKSADLWMGTGVIIAALFFLAKDEKKRSQKNSKDPIS